MQVSYAAAFLLLGPALVLGACNTSPSPAIEAGGQPAPETQSAGIQQVAAGDTDLTWLRSLEVDGNAVVVSENVGGGDEDFREKYRFDVTPEEGAPYRIVLYYSDILTRIAREMADILPHQELWYLERNQDTSAAPLVYLNFQPTYEEAESYVIAYLTGDERLQGVFRGGWIRENDSNPKPPALEWSLTALTVIAARGF